MSFDSDMLIARCLDGMAILGIFGFIAFVVWGLLSLAHSVLTLPMRRAERARLFLELIESAIKQGQPVEETLISFSQSHDMSMGPRFHLVAAWMEENLPLVEALAKVPRFLPAQVTAMLRAGRNIGDLRKVLPACRQLLKDAVSQTRGAINYLVLLTFVLTPSGIFVASVLKVAVLPKFMEIANGTLGEGVSTASLAFVFDHLWTWTALQCFVLLLLWLAVLIYMGGPGFVSWFPILERLHYWLPWRRKRLQRDFSTMLAILLDSGVPEAEAVTLAADCTANKIFRRRADRATNSLKQGLKLTQALQTMDDSGEFGWRLTNAIHGSGGFLKALAGWHESLDAKAFQEEQAAAHAITSALVLWSGLFVGVVVISVFMFLVSLINAGVLW
jgi:type IV pilus assembly protein PilC